MQMMCAPGKCVWLYTLIVASLYIAYTHASPSHPGQIELNDVIPLEDDFQDASDKRSSRSSFWKRNAGFWKRSDDEALAELERSQQDEMDKRAKYFLGKKAKYFLGKRGGNRNMFLGKREDEIEEDTLEDEKRARMAFLGKRGRTHFLGKRGRTHFLGKRDPDMPYEDDMEFSDDAEKRAKYFLGKRAKYFLGKRQKYEYNIDDLLKRAKYFLGKRSDEEEKEEEKRQKYFLGKRSVESEAAEKPEQ